MEKSGQRNRRLTGMYMWSLRTFFTDMYVEQFQRCCCYASSFYFVEHKIQFKGNIPEVL